MIPLNEGHLRQVLREWVAITIAGVHMRAWDLAFRRTQTSCRCRVAIGFARATASSPLRFWAVFITSTASSHELRDAARATSRLIADYRSRRRACSGLMWS